MPVGHGGTYLEPNGGAAASVAVSWLDWQLRGDATAERRFVGEDCGLCRDAQWTLQRRNFDGVSAAGGSPTEDGGTAWRRWARYLTEQL